MTFCAFLGMPPLLQGAEKESPEWIVEQFFRESGFPEKNKYYGGEFSRFYSNQSTLGEMLGPGIEKRFRILELTSDRCVIAVTLTKETQHQEWYAFLEMIGGSWKFMSIRTMTMTGLSQLALEQLQQKDDPDEEEQFQIKNLQLFFSSDEKAKAHLIKNMDGFTAVVTYLDSRPEVKGLSVSKRYDLPASSIPEGKRLLTGIYIDSVIRRSEQGGLYDFLVGGIVDNSMGYIYARKKARLPKLSPNSFYYIEKIAENWYIYKTNWNGWDY